MSIIGQEASVEYQKLLNLYKSATAQLMAHSQTVQELMKANMDLRAALHLAQTDKNGLDMHINAQLNPAPDASQALVADADTVSS